MLDVILSCYIILMDHFNKLHRQLKGIGLCHSLNITFNYLYHSIFHIYCILYGPIVRRSVLCSNSTSALAIIHCSYYNSFYIFRTSPKLSVLSFGLRNTFLVVFLVGCCWCIRGCLITHRHKTRKSSGTVKMKHGN